MIDVHLSPKPEKGNHAGLDINNLKAHEALLQTGKQNEAQVVSSEAFGPPAAFEFLKECLYATKETQTPRLARFMIPLQEGTIIKSDILAFRLRDAFWAEKVASFASPLQVFPGRSLPLDDQSHDQDRAISFLDIIRASAGAVLLKHGTTQPPSHPTAPSPLVVASKEVEADFAEKVSLPIISNQPLTRKRLVIVGSSNQGPSGGGWSQFARHAAHNLGIDLVIVDREDGWLATGDFSSWYEALLHPSSPGWWNNPSAEEIVRLVQEYKTSGSEEGKEGEERRIDGLATFIEALQAPVTMAAERLNLPHEPVWAFETATNKYNLGLFQQRPAFLVSTAEEIVNLLLKDAAKNNGLAFPLIVKPCFGLNSEGVSRVDRAEDLEAAVRKARSSGRSRAGGVGDGVLVERYCEGPEVDVNMVFVDGEVVFDEICDDFPKGAEIAVNSNSAEGKDREGGVAATEPGKSDSGSDNFQETNMVFPSALPANELAALRDAVSTTIRGLGFRNGVMHVEARVANSRCEYRQSADDGIVDLGPRRQNDKNNAQDEIAADTPKPWIIEVNPRPPGLFASQTPGSVYGVDYWAISLLLAIGDKARAEVISRPFITTTSDSPSASPAQNHTVLVMIRAEFDFDPSSSRREGVFDSDDVCEELLARHPELREHVGLCGCLLQRGQKIPDPREGKNTFVAYFNVFSRTSRLEALQLAKKVREEVRYEIR